MGLTIPFDATIAANAVWSYITRNLTNPAAAQDLLNMLVGISPTATGRAALLDQITALRMAELDPANMPGDIDTLLARLTAARAGYLNNINNAQLLNLPNVKIMQFELEFPTGVYTENMEDTSFITTELTATVALPVGATIVRAMIVGVVDAINGTAVQQTISFELNGRKGAGAWSASLYNGDLSIPAVELGFATTVAFADVSSLVDEAATYGFRLNIDKEGVDLVAFVTRYLLVITYRMS